MGQFSDLVPREMGRNVAFRRAVLEAGYSSAESALEIREMCARDCLFYVNTFAWTYNPRLETATLPFVTWGFQEELLERAVEAISKSRRTGSNWDLGIKKSRDMGVTWTLLLVFEWFWHWHAGCDFLLSSRDQSYVDEIGEPKSLFWKIDFLHSMQPWWLKPEGKGERPRKLNQLKNARNGSIFKGEATTENVARGDRLTALFLDEFSACQCAGGIDTATGDATRCRIFNGTPQGTGNVFYQLLHSKRVAVLEFHWSRHPEKNRGLYRCGADGKLEVLDGEHPPDLEKAKEVLSELRSRGYRTENTLRSPWYDQECLRRTPQQVAQELDIDFHASQALFFDQTVLAHLQAGVRPEEERGDLSFDEWGRHPTWRRDPTGLVRLWGRMDLARLSWPPDAQFAIGVDVATGGGGPFTSNSVASVVNRKTGEKVAELASHTIAPSEFAVYVAALARWFNDAYVTWEANGPGSEFGATFVECLYENFYYRSANEKSRKKDKTSVPGWWSDAITKRAMLTQYGDALRRGRFVNPCDESIKELGEYVLSRGGEPVHAAATGHDDPGGAPREHGDRVIADALAWKGVLERPVASAGRETASPAIRNPPYGSLAWRTKQHERAGAARESNVDF